MDKVLMGGCCLLAVVVFVFIAHVQRSNRS